MAIAAKDVMTLRNRTGLGMMECKKALTEADGDMDKAVELLRERLGKKMEDRSGREAAEGVVAVAQRDGEAAMVKLQSETDFVARNEAFVEAGKQLATLALEAEVGDVTPPAAMQQIVDELRISTKENISIGGAHKMKAARIGTYVHHNHQVGVLLAAEGELPDDLLTGICQHIAAAVPEPLAVDETGLPVEALDAQREQAVQEAEATGKPREIAEKIAQGKIKKWIDENTLLGQDYLRDMDAKKPIRDYLPQGAKLIAFVKYKMKG